MCIAGAKSRLPRQSLPELANGADVETTLKETLPLSLSLCLSVCRSVGPSVGPSIRRSVYLFLFACLPAWLAVCLSVSVSVSVFACAFNNCSFMYRSLPLLSHFLFWVGLIRVYVRLVHLDSPSHFFCALGFLMPIC